MAALWWMSVTVALLMSGDGLARMTQNQLPSIVQELLNRYRPSYVDETVRYPMFSLAVSIPYSSSQRMYDVSQVTDSGDMVREVMLQCKVYSSTRVVAATVLRWPNVLSQCPNEAVQWPHVLKSCPRGVVTWADVQRQCPDAVYDGRADHAEYRTLQHFNNLLNKHNKEDFLLFYVLASPCDQRCTSETSHWSILKNINQILNWKNYAVVFSDIFIPRKGTVTPEERREALRRLGTYSGQLGSVGLNNIFRCNQQHGSMQCTSCSTQGQVTPYCYLENVPPGPSNNLRSTRKGRSDCPSQNGPDAGVSSNVDGNTGGGQCESGTRLG